MRTVFLILISILLLSLGAAQTVEIQQEGVQATQVQNNETILSFNVEGEFDSAEAKITGVEEKGSNLRLTSEMRDIVTAPTDVENLTFTVREPGTYHVIPLNQTQLGYDQENRNCLRFYQLPENFEAVDECPEQAGTPPLNREENDKQTGLIPLVGIATALLATTGVLYVLKSNL